MAHGTACSPESPGFRRGLFVWVARRPRSPGWKPGDTGCENHPAVDAARLRGITASHLSRMAHGTACDPESPGFRRGLFVWVACRPRSPGWKPGDTGCENHPAGDAARLRGITASHLSCMAHGTACSPESPGFRRGLFVWVACRPRSPGWRIQRSSTAAFGRRSVNVVPTPGVLSTATVPPCACTMCLTIASPRPVPPCWRLRALSTR